MIEFCIQCHNFQRRLIWQLSSLREQVYNMDDVLINISSLEHNGDPTTEEVIEYFKKEGLRIKHTTFFDQDLFAKRGLVRNRNIIESCSDWLFFADADVVYHPEFFVGLASYLSTNGSHITNCITSISKLHTEPDMTNRLMDNTRLSRITNCFQKAGQINIINKTNKKIAGGAMQVVKRSAIPDLIYVPYSKDRDLFKQGQRAKSDIQFRKRMGGTTIIDLPLQIHLNHYRDKEAGHHLEEQR